MMLLLLFLTLIFTISNGYAIPLNGRSRSGVNGYLINYQEGHWVAVEGYTNSGSYFKIVDPAAGIPGFENVPQKYTASKSSVRNRISYGIIGDKNELKN